jgi:hypothetical protein
VFPENLLEGRGCDYGTGNDSKQGMMETRQRMLGRKKEEQAKTNLDLCGFFVALVFLIFLCLSAGSGKSGEDAKPGSRRLQTS